MACLKHLNFTPFPGLKSPHLQTIISSYMPKGEAPPSECHCLALEDGDSLWYYLSTPPQWTPSDKTVLLVHGLTGDVNSCYMVRMSRKLYQRGYRVARLNLRSAGQIHPGMRRHYHGGTSQDVYAIIKKLKHQTPSSAITLIGFSLGGNILLKLAGELEKDALSLIEMTIAVCPPLDLGDSSKRLTAHSIYNQYYMWHLTQQTKKWTHGKTFKNLIEFDNLVTAPCWGFHDAHDYYKQCSSRFFIERIGHPCHIIFAKDDPLIDYQPSEKLRLPPNVQAWLSPYGGHLGFLGKSSHDQSYFWLDSLLVNWT